MLSFTQDDTGVSAQVRERGSGTEYTIFANYMIAADGADSPVREQLGIARVGVGHIRTIRSVLFRCDEAEAYLDRGPQQFEIEQSDFKAFLTHYPDGRWVLMFGDDVDRSDDELRDAIRRALGRDMAVEIMTTGRWEMAGRIAERYGDGRIFLAGDAAHQLPPTRGGFGANTGIDDVYNIAWKLRMVLAGEASPTLLDTYSAERQSIGWLRHQQTFARPDYRRWVGDALAHEPLYGTEAMELGQRVRSAAVIGSDDDLPPAADPDVWSAPPGNASATCLASQRWRARLHGRPVHPASVAHQRRPSLDRGGKGRIDVDRRSRRHGARRRECRLSRYGRFASGIGYFHRRSLPRSTGCDRRLAIRRHGCRSK